jgi:hypothetical protein
MSVFRPRVIVSFIGVRPPACPFLESLPLLTGGLVRAEVLKGRAKMCLSELADVLRSWRGDPVVEYHEVRGQKVRGHVLENNSFPLGPKFGVIDKLL